MYREFYVSFADYVRTEFALALSSANSIINSFDLAQGLIADGVKLPRDITPTAVRPLAMLSEFRRVTDELLAICAKLESLAVSVDNLGFESDPAYTGRIG